MIDGRHIHVTKMRCYGATVHCSSGVQLLRHTCQRAVAIHGVGVAAACCSRCCRRLDALAGLLRGAARGQKVPQVHKHALGICRER